MEKNRHGFTLKVYRKHLLPNCASIIIDCECEHGGYTADTLKEILEVYVDKDWVDRMEIDILRWEEDPNNG